MRIVFSKYQGTGNDFILIDNRVAGWKPGTQQVARLCDRHFGIGADGLMLLGEGSGVDFSMVYFNSDGRESTMCGNGGRCMAVFARRLGLTGETTRFSAADGVHEALFPAGKDAPVVRLGMQDSRIGGRWDDGVFIDTGSPHFVVFDDEVRAVDVTGRGRTLRSDPRFGPGGTNVDFVERVNDGLFVRTYERGVENETLSCGTGVTASALVSALVHGPVDGPVKVTTPGGVLEVRYGMTGNEFRDIWLEGPALLVFEGSIELI